MSDCFLASLFCCALAVAANAQQSAPVPPNASAPAKAASAADSTKPEGKSREYSQESFVIEQMHSHYRFESDGTGRKETVARIRVQSEAGVQQWGQLQEGYNSANERVEIPYVRVLKEDGTVVKAGDDAVQDLSAPLEQKLPSTPIIARSTSPFPGCAPAKSSNTTWSR